MEKLSTYIRDRTHRHSFLSIKHILLNAFNATRNMVGMVAHGGIEMREQHFKQDIGCDRISSANEPLRFKEFLQVVEGRNHFVAGCHDIVLADNEIQLLAHAIAVFGTGGREMENEAPSLPVRHQHWHWRTRPQLQPYAH